LGFTTVELKCNLISTALEGDAVCIAKPVHRGRTTQVWTQRCSRRRAARRLRSSVARR
jgi:acyl-coenzyme A thioesterase PaaI-like protein